MGDERCRWRACFPFRRDENFDLLIRQIYPDLEDFEERQEKEIELFNKKTTMSNIVAKSLSAQASLQEDTNKVLAQ